MRSISRCCHSTCRETSGSSMKRTKGFLFCTRTVSRMMSICFSPLDSWTDISGSCGGRKFIFDTGNGGVATVHSSIEKHFSRLSFSEELSKDFPDSCYSESDAIEVSFLNSSINGNPLCVSTYKLWGDTAMDSVGIWYWSFAILKSQNGDEECVLSVLEPDKYGGNEVVVHFMNKVRFP